MIFAVAFIAWVGWMLWWLILAPYAIFITLRDWHARLKR